MSLTAIDLKLTATNLLPPCPRLSVYPGCLDPRHLPVNLKETQDPDEADPSDASDHSQHNVEPEQAERFQPGSK